MKAERIAFAVLAAVVMTPSLLFAQGESMVMAPAKPTLPEQVGGWRLEEPPRRIDETNIFEYMDGAGELYLSYHFDHLLVYSYLDQDGHDNLVELYQMKDSRDAFGLLSLDWGGEPVRIGAPGAPETPPSIVPPQRALYGRGLLRLWSDDLYVRILAYRETPETRETILELAALITRGRENPLPPELLKVIRPDPDIEWRPREDRTSYFYSHLVLNSLLYLSHENILDLGPSTEAVITTFERKRESGGNSARLLVIRYPDPGAASRALRDFSGAYLPEHGEMKDQGREWESREFYQVEDGWLGWKLSGPYLALVLGCPDARAAREILERADLD